VWFAIWSVLGAAALVVPLLLGLGLWRRAKALGRDLAAAGERAAEAFDHPVAEPERARPTLFASDTASRSHQVRAVNHMARDVRHSATLRRAVDRWARHGLVGRVPSSLTPSPQS